MVLGREVEFAELGASTARLEAGVGGSMLLVGEAGIGKSSLLQELEHGAMGRGWRVVRATGVESESELAWAAVADLLRPLLGEVDELLPARAAAVRAVLALDDPVGAAEVEPFAAGLAALDLVLLAAREGPLVLVVDDLQWVDQSSRRAIGYLARRLRDVPVLLVAGQRSEHDTSGFDQVVAVGPISRAAAEAFLEQHQVADRTVRRQLYDELGGNPLVLGEVCRALTASQRSGRERLPSPLPLPTTSRLLLSLRLGDLPESTRRALVVAAADTSGAVDRVLDALGRVGLGMADLEPAEEHGVVAISEGEIRFAHPLLRSAAYHDRPAPERRRAHAALASATPAADPRRAWHLAGATVGTDEDAAAALDALAADDVARGAVSSAAVAFERAARLSPEPRLRAVRLRHAAEALARLGDVDSVSALVDRIAELPVDPSERAKLNGLRGQVLAWRGRPAEALAVLRGSAAEVADADPDLAAEQLFAAAASIVRSVDVVGFVEVAGVVRELAPRLRPANALRAEVVVGFALLAGGDLVDGMRQLGRYRELLASESVAGAAPFLAEVVAPCLSYLVRAPEARALLDELEGELRARGSLVPLVAALAARALLEQTHDLRASIGAAQEALQLAEAVGHPALAYPAALVLAVTTAQAGEADLCRQHLVWMQSVDLPFAERIGWRGLGLLELGLGDLDAALGHYEALRDRYGFGTGIQRWEPELAEVLIRLRRPDEARQVLDDLGRRSDLAASLLSPLERCRGMLAADDDEAIAHFTAAAQGFALVSQNVGIARTELAWGERLRRARRRAEARVHLQAAVDGFRSLGATPWAARAAAELHAAGGAAATGDAAPHQVLSTQELQVARLVGTGATNREVASVLFVSPRTVETHVTSIFRKLGLRNRRELVALAGRDASLGA